MASSFRRSYVSKVQVAADPDVAAITSHFPKEVVSMISEMIKPGSEHNWAIKQGWLVSRLKDEDDEEIVISIVLGRLRLNTDPEKPNGES